MTKATHFYAWSAKLTVRDPRLGWLATGRFQTCGEVTKAQAEKLIREMNHGSLGAFEDLDVTLIHTCYDTVSRA